MAQRYDNICADSTKYRNKIGPILPMLAALSDVGS